MRTALSASKQWHRVSATDGTAAARRSLGGCVVASGSCSCHVLAIALSCEEIPAAAREVRRNATEDHTEVTGGGAFRIYSPFFLGDICLLRITIMPKHSEARGLASVGAGGAGV